MVRSIEATSKACKVVLLGDAWVGKTCLVQRCLDTHFDGTYRATVGTRVDEALRARSDGSTVRLHFWDMAGSQRLAPAQQRALHGAQVLWLVADGTRGDTVDVALALAAEAQRCVAREVPMLLSLNKADLAPQWDVDLPRMQALASRHALVSVSARSGQGIEQACHVLAGACVRAASAA